MVMIAISFAFAKCTFSSVATIVTIVMVMIIAILSFPSVAFAK
jgi:hypothetical protein